MSCKLVTMATRRCGLNARVFTPTRPLSPLLQRKWFIPVREISTAQSKIHPRKHGSQILLASLAALTTGGVAVGSLYPKLSSGEAPGDPVAPQDQLIVDPFFSARSQTTEANPGLEALPLQGQEAVEISKLPRERAHLTSAPEVPPPIERDYPVLLEVPLVTKAKVSQLTGQYKYEQWTFNGTVPGPFIRARVGDVVEVSLTNKDESGNPHNIDCHAFTGPGGGAAVTTAEEDETKTARFRLLHPGLYPYHCAAAPVPVHIANGMYGLLYVEPAGKALPPVDREYYVMQSEFYHEPPETDDDGRLLSQVEFSYPNALREEPSIVVFNGNDAALTRDKPLKAKAGESVRIFFGNAGPNLTSSFHIIGGIFSHVYHGGSVIDPPAHSIGTISVPPGGAAIVGLDTPVPGTYTIVDHAIFRLDKGAVGYLNVSGDPNPEVYQSAQPPAPCVGCKLHP